MIRRASTFDIEQINELGNILYSNFANKYDIKSYLENSKYIILVEALEIVKSVLIVYKNIDYFEIETIVTKPEFRQKGYAFQLLDYFINNYTKNKDTIILEVKENNESAISLYEKFGFSIVGKRKKYYGDYDAILMKKVIK